MFIYVTQKNLFFIGKQMLKIFKNFISFYQQKGYKAEPLGYNLTKFGQMVENKIIRN